MAFVHGGAPPPATEVAGFDDVRGVIEEKGGVLLVSGHVGDWIAASRLTKFRSRLIWVVAAQGMGAGGPHQVHRDGGAHLYRIINADAHSVAVGAQIAAALRSGGLVALFGDRRVSADVVRLPFLGGEADFPTGPWAVALVTGAPVVVSFMLRMPDGSNRMQFYGPIRVASTSREGRATAIGSGAAQFARYLEDAVRQSPFQWANFSDFWDVR